MKRLALIIIALAMVVACENENDISQFYIGSVDAEMSDFAAINYSDGNQLIVSLEDFRNGGKMLPCSSDSIWVAFKKDTSITFKFKVLMVDGGQLIEHFNSGYVDIINY